MEKGKPSPPAEADTGGMDLRRLLMASQNQKRVAGDEAELIGRWLEDEGEWVGERKKVSKFGRLRRM